MPRPSPTDTTTGNSYPLDLIRQVAAQIGIDAGKAQQQHDDNWRAVQSYLDTLPGILRDHFRDLLNRHQQRLRASYQWQLDFANALFQVAQAIDDAEHGIQDLFDPRTGTLQRPGPDPSSLAPSHGRQPVQ